VAKFRTIGYGDAAGYERTDPYVSEASHEHDARCFSVVAACLHATQQSLVTPSKNGVPVRARL